MDGGRHVLVVGGQRSGKSRYAEGLVLGSGLRPVYLATGTGGDGEMRDRIARHQARRGAEWTAVEVPLALADGLATASAADRAVLVDCLTLWLSNIMAAGRNPEPEAEELANRLGCLPGPAVLVSGEVGSGIVPDNALGRQFADGLGRLNQIVAAAVGRVVLVTAGQPVLIKPSQTREIRL